MRSKPYKKKVIHLTIGALLFALSSSVEAQQGVFRIGVLVAGSPTSMATRVGAFREGLRNLGYVEGRNVTLEFRYADGTLDRVQGYAEELVRLKPDVIVTWTTSVTQVVKKVNPTIPIVMAGGGSDPVRDGLIMSLSKPGGNITGVTTVNQELAGKQLELLKETHPKVSRVALLWNPEDRSDVNTVKQLQSASRWLEVQIQPHEIRRASDLDEVFSRLGMNHPNAIFVVSSPIINLNRAKVVDFAAKNKLPGMYPDRRWVEAGGLMAYAYDLVELGRRAATYIDKILKGANPADLPVEQPTKFELVINLKTAKQIGLIIRPNVLARADRVIK